MKILIEFRVINKYDMVEYDWIETKLNDDLTIDTDLLINNAKYKSDLYYGDEIYITFNKIYHSQIAFTDSDGSAAYYTGNYEVLDYDCSDEEAEKLLDRLNDSIVE